MTNDTTGPEPNEWRNLIDFEIPGPTQNRISDVFQIQALYTAYVKTFEDVHELNATRMHYAKALAFAILTHYYPKSQGFTVAPTSPGPIAKHGMNFILAADDGSDIWTDMPTKKPNTKNKSKKRRRAPTQKELEQANKVAKAAEWNHGVLGYAVKLRWDQVQPEDIAAFAVVRRSEMVDQYTGEVTYKWRPHTYLAIMIDNFDSLPRFSAANVTHRSDILSEALCRQGSIQEGYGMLLYGPRLEFYGFEAGERWVYPEGEVGDVEEEETRDIEPRIQVLKMGAQEMEMDLRARGLQAVDGAFRYVASRKVVYRAEEKGEEKEGEEASDIDAEGEDDDML
ncbi:hypothetical protein BDW02DRAFT_501328 [Decorospora gaudefroyi]|uniref:Uncharacterized protein n=1 Tax=Decorospora gaudefroyi TaxID=184978 RepID=A0A6A5KDP7_9PLEO|nr:hypothetical protein BDW02DRAFT_501328 [Decorospora gaudefroyi]